MTAETWMAGMKPAMTPGLVAAFIIHLSNSPQLALQFHFTKSLLFTWSHSRPENRFPLFLRMLPMLRRP
jgi:hypothetical protein